MKIVSTIVLTALFISNQSIAIGFGGDFQGNVCHVKNGDEAAKNCENSDVILYQPSSFGNEQLPIIISAAFCDYEHPIVYNSSGVSCIFTDTRKNNWSAFGIKTTME
jgi:hypothetical protein